MILGWSVAWAGSLSGRVTGPDGAPVDGALVQIDGVTTTIVVAGADGRYQATDLPDDGYRVFVLPPSESGLSSAWAPSARTACDGARFDVLGDAETTGADVSVVRGAAIRGTILLPDGTPAAGADLTVVTDYLEVRTGITADDGGFAIGGLVPGAGRMSVDTAGVPLQFLGGSYSPTAVVPFDLVAGDEVDLGEVVLLPGVSLSGTVTIDGERATAGQVIAYGPGIVAEVEIASDGTWAVDGLPPGELTVWALSDGFATTWWPDADRPRTFLNLEDGDHQAGMDLDLPPEAEVVGQLLGDHDWSQVGISLRNDDGTVALSGVIGDDGRFRVGGLHGGSYVLFVEAADVGGTSDTWRDDDGEERVLVVPSEGTLDLGAVELADGATLEGRVVDAESGLPVAGTTVIVEQDATRLLYFAATDTDGRYRVDGLSPSTYEVMATADRPCATDDGWVAMHHAASPNPVFSAPLVIRDGGVHTWDVALPPDDDHDGMDDTWESHHGLDPELDDSSGDPDHDGFVNLAEYLFDTDPTDAPTEACGCGGRRDGSVALLGVAVLAARRRRFGIRR